MMIPFDPMPGKTARKLRIKFSFLKKRYPRYGGFSLLCHGSLVK